ncbi:hypothetical protein ACFLT7_08655, partial [candidate division KSB1 bacterium]
ANGADKSVQGYLAQAGYRQVVVCAICGDVRNNVGNWEVKCVRPSTMTKDFKYYVEKDKKMAEEADYGFMIWDSKSRGALNNIVNMLRLKKATLVYLTSKKEFFKVNNFADLKKLLENCSKESLSTFEEKLGLSHIIEDNIKQPALSLK